MPNIAGCWGEIDATGDYLLQLVYDPDRGLLLHRPHDGCSQELHCGNVTALTRDQLTALRVAVDAEMEATPPESVRDAAHNQAAALVAVHERRAHTTWPGS